MKFPKTVKVLLGTGIAGALLSCLSVFSEQHLYFDLLSHFRIQYIVLIIPFFLLSIFGKNKWSAAVLLGCLLIHLFEVVGSQLPRASSREGDGPVLRIMSSNLLSSNEDFESQIQYVAEIDPDLIVFQEYTSAWHRTLSKSLKNYPYKVTSPLESPFGIAVYSKEMIEDGRTMDFGTTYWLRIEGTLNISGRELQILGVHTPPPLSQHLYRERNEQLKKLVPMLRKSNSPYIVIGDLNTSPWSSHFKSFVNDSRLRDSRRGHGIFPTWNTSIPPMMTPIDYILLSEELTSLEMGTSRGLESDHRTIWADIRID